MEGSRARQRPNVLEHWLTEPSLTEQSGYCPRPFGLAFPEKREMTDHVEENPQREDHN